jgi:hypothetical protein
MSYKLGLVGASGGAGFGNPPGNRRDGETYISAAYPYRHGGGVKACGVTLTMAVVWVGFRRLRHQSSA